MGSIKTLVKLFDHVQAQSKHNRVLREYTRRQQLVNKSRADRSPLITCEFYRSQDFVESSHTDPTTELPIVTDGQEFDVVSSSSSQTPSLIFSSRRKKRPHSQDERNQMADKRFRLMMEEPKMHKSRYQSSPQHTRLLKLRQTSTAAELALRSLFEIFMWDCS